MRNIVITFGMVALSLTAQASDQPIETRLHDIYKSSYSEEVSDETWEQFVSGLQDKSYTVKAGDSLWILSEVFFGDGFFWSKIWSYNSSLTNPHLLSIGKKIYFFTGSTDRPPGVMVGSNTSNGVETLNYSQSASGDTTTIEQTDPNGLYPGAPLIPAPRSAAPPLVTNFPSSFADSDVLDPNKYSEKGISLDIRPPADLESSYLVSQFYYGSRSSEYPRVAEFVESDQSKDLIGLNDTVFLKSEEKLAINEVLTVMGEDYRFDRNGTTGTVIKYVGRVRVDAQISEKEYRGTVILSLSGVRRGAWLVRQPIPTINDDLQGRPYNKNLKVIGGGEDNISRIYARGDVVYLQGGKKHQVQVGDVVPIYKLRSSRYRNSKLRLSPDAIGYAKIFHVEDLVSSALIVSSSEPIMPGDETAYDEKSE